MPNQKEDFSAKPPVPPFMDGACPEDSSSSKLRDVLEDIVYAVEELKLEVASQKNLILSEMKQLFVEMHLFMVKDFIRLENLCGKETQMVKEENSELRQQVRRLQEELDQINS